MALVLEGSTAQLTPQTQVDVPWHGETHRDFHNEYANIFIHGNRNAASHRWTSFLLNRAHQMSASRLEYMFSSFCAVSGSPVNPSEYTRYAMTIDAAAGGGRESGFTYYCCWPCVCDTQDFIKVDTKTVQTADGERQYRFLVIGNPCDHPEELTRPFVQPFDQRLTTLAQEAREVRCEEGGVLEGAVMSDNGFVIIGMFFPASSSLNADSAEGAVVAADAVPAAPPAQQQQEFQGVCSVRAQNGYNSGMGEIFRKVAAISPIGAATAAAGQLPGGDTSASAGAVSGEAQGAGDCLDYFDKQYGVGYCTQRAKGPADALCAQDSFKLNCRKTCGLCEAGGVDLEVVTEDQDTV